MENNNKQTIDYEEHNDIIIVHTNEVMDMEYSTLLVEFRKTIFSDNKYCVIFDLDKTDYINSTAMGSLMSYVKNSPSHNTIKLCNVRPHILEVLSMTRFDKLFGIYETLDEAVESFSKDS